MTERTRIEKDGADARFTEDDGATWTHLSGNTIVSMNLWGFTESFLKEAEARFPAFLDKALAENPLKGEYFLPSVVTQLLEEKKARVKVAAQHRQVVRRYLSGGQARGGQRHCGDDRQRSLPRQAVGGIRTCLRLNSFCRTL